MEYQEFKFLGYEIQIWQYSFGNSSALATHQSGKAISKSFKTDKVESIFRAMKHEVDYMERIKD